MMTLEHKSMILETAITGYVFLEACETAYYTRHHTSGARELSIEKDAVYCHQKQPPNVREKYGRWLAWTIVLGFAFEDTLACD